MRKRLAALLGAAILAAVLAAPSAQAGDPSEYGLEAVEASLSSTQAGAHPDLTITAKLKEDPESKVNAVGLREPYAYLHDLSVQTPAGLVGDPNVLGLPQQCTLLELIETESCPNGSQVGVATVSLFGITDSFGLNLIATEPIYMMTPPGGDVVARMAFFAGTNPFFLDFKVRSDGDYGLTTEIVAAPPVKVVKAETTIWGVPADPSHDDERCTPAEVSDGCQTSVLRPPGSRPLPFITNPTSCGADREVKVSVDSWAHPELVSTMSGVFPTITGCNKVPFGPALAVTPTSHKADSPTGLEVRLNLPESEGVETLATAHLRDARVTLPEGMTIATGAADGLDACSESQVRFGKNEAAHCPSTAKIASAEFDIPALARRMKGAVYLRTPEPGNLFRVWLVADDLGAHVKLRGELEVDEESGQITTIVLDAPQTPLREVEFSFKSGSRAALATPRSCGTYLTHWRFTPWSGNPDAEGDSSMRIDEGCDTGSFSPKFSAGTTSPAAGGFSPFVFDLIRADGEQNPATLDVTLPPGLVAKLAGVTVCQGAEAQSGNCPASSKIGTVSAATGPGAAPLWVPQPGKDPTAAYLAGPYKGAPYSILVVVPAQAGPFDLGTVTVRSAINVDPRSARVTVSSDPLPQILQGVPISYRHIHVAVDRPGFTLNPTSCAEMAVGARIASAEGKVASPSSRFQAAGCRGLAFEPRLSMRLLGGTRRGAHPRLKAIVSAREGDANLAGAVVRLPRSAFLDQGHIRTICTRVQFAAKACPAAAIYGHATAFTPLLDQPLQGPVYLRSSDHNLPDLVMDLHGPIDVEAVGRIDSIKGGIRASFEDIPDAPLSKVVVEMQGGKKGLIVNSRNLCAKPSKATAELSAQSGKAKTLHPQIKASCAKDKRKAKKSHQHDN